MIVTLKKEWIGESGYCNCLLVTMSRLSLPQVELRSDQPPPDLEALASSRPATAAWLHAQQFDYSALDTAEIIATLAESAGLKRSFWRSTVSGCILAHDCVEDDGPQVERHFDLRLSRTSHGARHLVITLRTRPNLTMQRTAR